MAGESLSYQVHHIIPTNVWNEYQAKLVPLFANESIFSSNDEYSNRINLFDNQEMASVTKNFYQQSFGTMDVAKTYGSVKHMGEIANFFV